MCMLVLQLAQQQANLEETNAKKQSELIGANCLPPLLCYVRLTRALAVWRPVGLCLCRLCPIAKKRTSSHVESRHLNPHNSEETYSGLQKKRRIRPRARWSE